jgi:TRAP-type mannitol/chloroaromatic compound transport system permease small subunit
MDLVLYILFFFPGMLAFIYAGFGFAELSRRMNEHSAASPNGPIVWPFKWLISIVGVLMVLQGIVEVIRCMMAVKSGEWPPRLHDVEELEKVMLEKAEHGEYAVVKELEEIGQQKGAI